MWSIPGGHYTEDNDLCSVPFSSLVASHSGPIYSCSLDSFLFMQSTNSCYTRSWVSVKLGVRSSTCSASGTVNTTIFVLSCCAVPCNGEYRGFHFYIIKLGAEPLSSSFVIQVASLVANVPER